MENNKISFKDNIYKWAGLFVGLGVLALIILLILNGDKALDAIYRVVSILSPVIYGGVIAYLLNPIVKGYQRIFHHFFEKKSFYNKKKSLFSGISIVLGLCTGILVIIVLCWSILPQLIDNISTLINKMPGRVSYYYEKLRHEILTNKFLEKNFQNIMLEATKYVDEKLKAELIPWLQRVILPNVNSAATALANGVIGVLNIFYNLFIGIIVAIYFLAGKQRFLAQGKKILYAIFKKNRADVLYHYLKYTNSMFSGFISAKVVDSIILGFSFFVAFMIFDVPYALLVSVIIGVTNVIPVFGPYIGGAPSLLLILIVDPSKIIVFLILFVVIMQIDANLIGPAIMGESTGLSAFWVLFAILLFGGLWGLVGMLVGVPLFAVIYRIASDIVTAKLKKKSMPVETELYFDLKSIENAKDGYVFVPYSEEELIGIKEKKPHPFMEKLRQVWKENEKKNKSSQSGK